ncbi:unnamed protein product [Protopolystoma xenopodis]|uniref:Uncharacterized protein n=1 Tax=Protopolystoma xenopodis TaxID=117903 RepID=A0A3S5CFT4_9PLAT|nr:unnamed protein product [Protopolystoma xenopodis]
MHSVVTKRFVNSHFSHVSPNPVQLPSMQMDEAADMVPQHFGTLHIIISYLVKKFMLQIDVGQSMEIPDKLHGGCSSYQVRLFVWLIGVGVRCHS